MQLANWFQSAVPRSIRALILLSVSKLPKYFIDPVHRVLYVTEPTEVTDDHKSHKLERVNYLQGGVRIDAKLGHEILFFLNLINGRHFVFLKFRIM